MKIIATIVLTLALVSVAAQAQALTCRTWCQPGGMCYTNCW